MDYLQFLDPVVEYAQPVLKFTDPYMDQQSAVLIAGGLLVCLLALLLRAVPYVRRLVPVWLLTGLLGVVLGGGGTMVALNHLGHHWTSRPTLGADEAESPPLEGESQAAPRRSRDPGPTSEPPPPITEEEPEAPSPSEP